MVDRITDQWVRTKADERAVEEGCRFDPGSAERVRGFFSKFLRHSKGQWAGKPFELLGWQWEDIVAPLFGWKRPDGSRRFRIAYVEIPKKNGKPVSIDTLIPTLRGMVPMEDVRRGDFVFDETGQPAEVVETSEIMEGKPCFELTFSDDVKIKAAAEHLWPVQSHSRKWAPCLLTTEEISQTLLFPPENRPRYRIAVAGQVESPDVALPIDPYWLGFWLGNGKCGRGDITIRTSDIDAILPHLVAAEGSPSSNWDNPGESRHYYFSGVALRLGAMGLKVDNEKFIPAAYLDAGTAQRWALFQGMMDSDGHVATGKGQCIYSTSSLDLRDGFMRLAASLGLKPTWNVQEATEKNRQTKDNYRIVFAAFKGDPVCRLARKLDRLPYFQEGQRSGFRYVTGCESIPSVPVRCIQVASPSHAYLVTDRYIPTHNSTLASGIGLYLLIGDGEPGAEIYSTGSDAAQASIVHGEAILMVKSSPGLSSRLKVNESTRTIWFRNANSSYRALSGEHAGKEGLNAHGLIVDELHVWHGRKTWDALKYAGRARRQPLRFVITTAGDDPLSVCREQHDYALAVNAGSIEDIRFFGYIRAAQPEDDWKDPATWRKANPSLGETIREDDFAADVSEAENSPAAESSFKRYGLNIWATSTSPWLREDDWKACRREYSEADLAGRDCWGGLDLASTRDLTAFVLCFRDGDTYSLLPYFWVPEGVVQDTESPEQYRVWAAQGVVRVTPGDVCDYAFVKRDVIAISQQFQLVDFAYDPWNAEKTTQEMEEEAGLKRISFGQTISNFAEPTKEFERLLAAQQLFHPGHPVLTWMAGNVSVRTDANGNRRPVKPPQGDRRKVDGIVAAVMSLGRSMRGEPGSVYESRGVEVVTT